MKQRVLVVDDDPRLVRVVAMYLSIEGYDVVTASDADAGLAEVDKQCPDSIRTPGTGPIAKSARASSASSTLPNRPSPALIKEAGQTSTSHASRQARVALSGAAHSAAKPSATVMSPLSATCSSRDGLTIGRLGCLSVADEDRFEDRVVEEAPSLLPRTRVGSRAVTCTAGEALRSNGLKTSDLSRLIGGGGPWR